MKIYHYDPYSLEFTGSSDADPDPLTPGEFLLPAYSTGIAPPKFNENQIPLFLNFEWQLFDDYRGQSAYSKTTREKFTIETFGKIPSELTVKKPPGEFHEWDELKNEWVENLDKHLESKHNELILLIRDKAQAKAIILDYSYPEFEKISWANQESEAKLYLSNQDTNAPFLSEVAKIRGVTVHELATRVIKKSDQSRIAYATIAGERQKLESEADRALASRDIDKLYSIFDQVSDESFS